VTKMENGSKLVNADGATFEIIRVSVAVSPMGRVDTTVRYVWALGASSGVEEQSINAFLASYGAGLKNVGA